MPKTKRRRKTKKKHLLTKMMTTIYFIYITLKASLILNLKWFSHDHNQRFKKIKEKTLTMFATIRLREQFNWILKEMRMNLILVIGMMKFYLLSPGEFRDSHLEQEEAFTQGDNVLSILALILLEKHIHLELIVVPQSKVQKVQEILDKKRYNETKSQKTRARVKRNINGEEGINREIMKENKDQTFKQTSSSNQLPKMNLRHVCLQLNRSWERRETLWFMKLYSKTILNFWRT